MLYKCLRSHIKNPKTSTQINALTIKINIQLTRDNNTLEFAFAKKIYMQSVPKKELVIGNRSRNYGTIFKVFIIFIYHFVFLIYWKRNWISGTFIETVIGI